VCVSILVAYGLFLVFNNSESYFFWGGAYGLWRPGGPHLQIDAHYDSWETILNTRTVPAFQHGNDPVTNGTQALGRIGVTGYVRHWGELA
jgi:hypothetical protein